MGIKNSEQKVWIRVILLAVLLSTLLLIFISGAATPVFLSFMLIIMALATRFGSVRKNTIWFVLLLLLFLPFFLSGDLLFQVIDFFANHISNESPIYARLMDLEDSIISNEAQGDVDGRMSLYTKTINEFVGSIIWGSNEKLGGHSAILDKLAALGLVGFIPYIGFIWSQIKQTYKTIPNNNKMFYIEGILAGVLMLVSKSMNNWEMWLMIFVLLPSMVLCFGKGNEQLTKQDDNKE